MSSSTRGSSSVSDDSRCNAIHVGRPTSVVTLIVAGRLTSTMNRNQIIALVFAFLMMSSMVAWGATALF
jgi:hypothetical protein